MTNAEKYKEVFGLEVDYSMCPTENCGFCPLHRKKEISSTCSLSTTYDWWNSEYKEVVDNG